MPLSLLRRNGRICSGMAIDAALELRKAVGQPLRALVDRLESLDDVRELVGVLQA
jgi:hypothetical protein